ncbi:MAG TPA: serine/threonine-protein kinase [Gemmataceae bacterium]|jgi:serine/threonine protein kinase
MQDAMPRIDELFWEAAQIAVGEQRDSYLSRACGDDRALRQRLERLLQALPKVKGFLEQPLIGPGQVPYVNDSLAEQPGAEIGPYKLHKQIGEGGMGLVFLAEQTRPMCRSVALKVIRPGMDSRQVVARFEAERQALALMDHPNIAKVFDGGVTASGRPYFVMELVPGAPITEFCEQHRLTIRQRLELFVTVCQAVQHAHLKGIIHRDLKPSNVLVTLHDTGAVPKVIDFGIAKAITQPLTERTRHTYSALLLGTPLYMSPEQVQLNGLDVDTRSDVYSLGVLLYELLTGTTPFQSRTLREVGLDELRRMIREDEPPTPSKRVSTLDAQACETISERRGATGCRLGQLLRGELDWIVMKSLEKERNRRYESASALAADVQHYLNDEAVMACPPSALYRLRKFARRKHRLLISVGIALGALVAATAVSSWLAVEARKAQRQAEADRDRAEAAEQQAAAINQFLQFDLLRQVHSDTQSESGFTAEPSLTVKEALRRAALKIGERFRDQPLAEAAIRKAIGESYRSMGEDGLAIAHLERAAELFEVSLGPDHRETLLAKRSLALGYQFVDRLPDAIVLLEHVLERFQATLGIDHNLTLYTLNCLGEACRKARKLEKARVLIGQALELKQAKFGPDNLQTIYSTHDLGLVYLDLHQWTQAIALLEEATRKHEIVSGLNHDNTRYSVENLAEAYEKAGRLEQANGLLRGFIQRLGEDNMRNLEQSIMLRVLLGRNLLEQEKPAEAESVLREALRICERQKKGGHPQLLAVDLLGEALVYQERFDEGEPLLHRGYEAMKQHKDWQYTLWISQRFQTRERLVRLYERTKRAEKGRQWQEQLREYKGKY